MKHNGDDIIILGRTEKDDVPIQVREQLNRGYRSSIHVGSPEKEGPFEDQYKI